MNCPICLEEVIPSEQSVNQVCGCKTDNYHDRCLTEWIQTSNKCPICRTNIFCVIVEDKEYIEPTESTEVQCKILKCLSNVLGVITLIIIGYRILA